MKNCITAAALAAALCVASGAQAAPMKDGVYTAKVNGHKAPITVQVTVKGDKIA